MDNLENYLYVLFAVIYIISRIIKARSKQKQANSPAPQDHQDHQAQPEVVKTQPSPKKAFSFQDILKEFEKNLAGEQHVEEEMIPVKEIRHTTPIPISAEKIDRKPELYKSYQRTSYKSPERSFNIKEEKKFERSDKFALKENVDSEYVKMLRDPNGFKNAIILSEIINRKYF